MGDILFKVLRGFLIFLGLCLAFISLYVIIPVLTGIVCILFAVGVLLLPVLLVIYFVWKGIRKKNGKI